MSGAGRSILVRGAVEADLEPAARVQASAMVASEVYRQSEDRGVEVRRRLPRLAGYFRGTYHPSQALAPRTVFVAESEGDLIGFVAGHLSTRMSCDGELQWIFVAPEWQRRGVGRRLLAPMAEWFVSRGCRCVVVDAPPANPAREFYLRHGARPLDAYWLHWPEIGRAIGTPRPR